MHIRPVSLPVGAEITDIDLATITDAEARAVHDALMQYGVVFFRDQDITPKQQVDFAKRYGQVPAAQKASFGVDADAPEISTLTYDRERPPNVNHYHPDGLFREKPEFASVLRAIEVPELGGDTIFVSGTAAYEALSDRMQRYLDGVYAINDFMNLHSRPSKARSWQGDGGKGMATVQGQNPPVTHPVVRTHPVTGKKSLYVCQSFTTYLADMPEREGRGVLEFLFEHVSLPEFQYRFQWRPNSIAFWDNRCTLHYAVADYWPAYRHMHRCSIRLDEVPV
ncbi:MAG: TauD/TfdA family dioxygenase [Alphaproteobacteria bacterium]|nr:TauD/TfdA family dioxygenase [Alphaproteobacteria bacterium]MCB9930120.1 TauD/TfdA family dioxygenase [Alphaproteobacteria bacterium]